VIYSEIYEIFQKTADTNTKKHDPSSHASYQYLSVNFSEL